MQKLILPFVILLILTNFVYSLYLTSSDTPYFSGDDVIYATLSKRFLSGDFKHAISPYWNPGFPFVTTMFFPFIHQWERAQIFVSIASTSFLSFLLFLFLKKQSLILALIVSVLISDSNIFRNFILKNGISEPLYIFVLWVSICFGWLSVNKNKTKYFILTGLFLGLAYLVRSDVIGIIISIFTVIAFKFLLSRNLKMLAHRLIITTTVFLLTISPYVAIMSTNLGRLTFSGKYTSIGSPNPYIIDKDILSTYAQDVFSVDYPVYASQYYDPSRATAFLKLSIKNGNFFHFAKKTFKESLKMYFGKTSGKFLTQFEKYLCLAGLIFGLAIKKFRKLTLFLSFIFGGELIWIAFFMAAEYRYLSFAFPLLFYLCGLGITGLYQLKVLQKISIFKYLSLVAVLIFMAYFFVNNKPRIKYRNVENERYKLAGEWVKSQNIKLIGAHFEGIGFYGDAKTVYIPAAQPDEIVNYMKGWGVEYMLIARDEIDPAFAKIASPVFKHPDLTLVNQLQGNILVWKINLTSEEKISNMRTLLNLD